MEMKKKTYLVTLLVLILDQTTKWLASVRLDGHEAIEIIPGYLRLSFLRNSGVAFGLFTEIQSTWKPIILSLMAVLAIIAIVVYSARTPLNRVMLKIALAMTMGGILGNLADRVIHGSVVDFIEFHIHESFYWPTFNVADSAITIGIALLLIDALRNPEAGESRKDPAPELPGVETRAPEQRLEDRKHESGN
jgi:signal peptidase II